MNLWKFIKDYWLDALAVVVFGIFFVVPFIFILLTAAKTPQEAMQFKFTAPSQFQLFENIVEVIQFHDCSLRPIPYKLLDRRVLLLPHCPGSAGWVGNPWIDISRGDPQNPELYPFNGNFYLTQKKGLFGALFF